LRDRRPRCSCGNRQRFCSREQADPTIQQPRHLEIATRLAPEPSARLHAIETVVVEFWKGRRVIARSSVDAGSTPSKLEMAADIKKAASEGRNALADCRTRKYDVVTFHQAYETFFANEEPTLSNAKHRAQWRSAREHTRSQVSAIALSPTCSPRRCWRSCGRFGEASRKPRDASFSASIRFHPALHRQ
jgi:hypothetical protein